MSRTAHSLAASWRMLDMAIKPQYQRVILTGFMGAGKSTVGQLLAPRLGWRFMDADALLVERSGATVSELFSRFGEPRFRQLEAALIQELLASEQVVVALGGGAVEHTGTRTRLAETPACLIVYLEAPLQVSLARCALEHDAAVRPVLQDTALLEQRFRIRLPLYQSAHLTVNTASLTPAQIAQRLADHMHC